MDRLCVRRFVIVLAVSATIDHPGGDRRLEHRTRRTSNQARPEDQRTLQKPRPEGVYQEI